MKTIPSRIGLAGLLLGAAVCLTQTGCPMMDRPMQHTVTEVREPTEKEIVEAFDATPGFTFPAKIALFMSGPSTSGAMREDSVEAKLAEMLRQVQQVSDVVLPSRVFIEGEATAASVRMAASYYQADLVLLCVWQSRVVMDVPAHEDGLQSSASMALLDTRNGRVYYWNSLTEFRRYDFIDFHTSTGLERVSADFALNAYRRFMADIRLELARLATSPPAEAPTGSGVNSD